jgi:PAS domain S-box-containing protein
VLHFATTAPLSAELVHAGVAASPVGLACLSVSGRMVFANDAWFAILEWPHEDVAGFDLREVIHPDEWESSQTVMMSLLEGPQRS